MKNIKTLMLIAFFAAVSSGNLSCKTPSTTSSNQIFDKYWKLVELYGSPISEDSAVNREPHITFRESDLRFAGNAGCNTFSGTYQLNGMNRIKLSDAISTKMACSNMEVEAKFLQALTQADSFTIQGDELILNLARMGPLARFEAVSSAR